MHGDRFTKLFMVAAAAALSAATCTLGPTSKEGHGGGHSDGGQHGNAVEAVVVDGWNDKLGAKLADTGGVELVAESDDMHLEIEANYFVSFRFNTSIPGNASMGSVHVGVEYHTELGFTGPITFVAGGGDVAAPMVVAMKTAEVKMGPEMEGTDRWDVTTDFQSPALVNDLKVKVANGDGGKKLRIDRVFVEVHHQ